jgi:hypothetical protein
MALSRHERTRRKADLNPLEMIERVVAANDWPFDRTSDREIAVEVAEERLVELGHGMRRVEQTTKEEGPDACGLWVGCPPRANLR